MPSLNSLKDKISASLKPGGAVILGLSGGPDSVFLFHQLLAISPRPDLIACHVNYHLRGKSSNLDQTFVENLCRKNNVRLEILSADKSIRKGNLENNCRNLRYDFFEKMRQKHHAEMTLVAHQLDDQLETFLLNLTRGSSLRGFMGMREYDPDRKLFRPLLDWQKKNLLQWLKTHKHKFRIDQSNILGQFTRNQIRNNVLPQLTRINPNFLVTAGHSISELSGQLELIGQLTDKWLADNLYRPISTAKTIDGIRLFVLDDFLAELPALQKNILRKIFQEIHKKSLTRQTLDEILTTLNKQKSGLKKEFGPDTFLKIFKHAQRKRLVVIERKLY